jgi:hypothetical protein
LAQDRVQWRTFVNTVRKKAGYFFTSWVTISFSNNTLHHGISKYVSKVCGIGGVPNECLRHLPRRPLAHLTHLLNHCFRLAHFPQPWKEANVITSPMPGKD